MDYQVLMINVNTGEQETFGFSDEDTYNQWYVYHHNSDNPEWLQEEVL